MHLDPTTQTELARQRAMQLRETMLAPRRDRGRRSNERFQPDPVEVARLFQPRPAARRAVA